MMTSEAFFNCPSCVYAHVSTLMKWYVADSIVCDRVIVQFGLFHKKLNNLLFTVITAECTNL